jgi:hypothetical protein
MRKQAPTSLVDSPTFRSNSSAFSIINMRNDGSLRLSRKAVEAPAIAPPITATSYEHAIKRQDSGLLLINQGDSKMNSRSRGVRIREFSRRVGRVARIRRCYESIKTTIHYFLWGLGVLHSELLAPDFLTSSVLGYQNSSPCGCGARLASSSTSASNLLNSYLLNPAR